MVPLAALPQLLSFYSPKRCLCPEFQIIFFSKLTQWFLFLLDTQALQLEDHDFNNLPKDWAQILLLQPACTTPFWEFLEHFYSRNLIFYDLFILFLDWSLFITNFKIGQLYFYCWIIRVFKYILDTSPSSDLWFTTIFSHSVSHLFTFSMISLAVQKFLILM